MRIATEYEVDSNNGNIIRPGEIVFDDILKTDNEQNTLKNDISDKQRKAKKAE